MDKLKFSYEDICKIAKCVKKAAECNPKVGIICGKGMCSLFEQLEGRKSLKCCEIDGFPKTTIENNGDEIVFGTMGGVPIVALTGRFYFCEGFSMSVVAMPVRLFKIIGCTDLLLLGTACSISDKLKMGDIMVIKDHINLVGFPGSNPLIGPNEEKFGERFPNLSNAYEKTYLKCAKKTAEDIGMKDKVHVGVYAALPGPNLQSVAETNLLSILGADATGISIVPEVVAAAHCGLKVMALCLITVQGQTDINNSIEACPQCSARILKNSLDTILEYMEKIIIIMGAQKPCAC